MSEEFEYLKEVYFSMFKKEFPFNQYSFELSPSEALELLGRCVQRGRPVEDSEYPVLPDEDAVF